MSSDKYKFKNVTYVSNSDVSIFSFHFLVCNIKLTLIYSPNTHTHMYIYAHTCTQFTNKHTHLLEMENQTINPQLLGTNQQPSSTTKVERRLIEKKNRRNQMKILYSKLNSLLPNYNPKVLFFSLIVIVIVIHSCMDSNHVSNFENILI